LLVPLDRLGIVEQVLVVLEHGCRPVKELHRRSVQGGRLREGLDFVVVEEGRQPREVGKVFVVV
jgi:hypothetical protein